MGSSKLPTQSLTENRFIFPGLAGYGRFDED